MGEHKTLADGKAAEIASQEVLNKIKASQLATQNKKYTRIEAKGASELERVRVDYEKAMNFRDRKEQITNIKCKTGRNRTMTIEIYKDHEKRNFDVYSNFKLKDLGFSGWLELHDAARKLSSKAATELKENQETSSSGSETQPKD